MELRSLRNRKLRSAHFSASSGGVLKAPDSTSWSPEKFVLILSNYA